MQVGCDRRAVEGEQEAAADHQPVWEDVGGFVERLADAAVVVVQQSAVQLEGRIILSSSGLIPDYE